MAFFKCKMCGGELELKKGVNIAECPYCYTKQTVPQLADDKILRLYNRANQYRLDSEFDKAYGAYETIISEKEDEAEAYWGLVLSEYGVEYVEDPSTNSRIPTCHRTLVKSVTSNENFKLACKFAESESRLMYEDEAEKLDSLQKKILNASAKEEPYDVFICYKETDDNGERTTDSVLAQEIYNELTLKGLRVFFSRITLEDKLGKDYEPCIYAALTSAKVMLVVTTDSDYCNAVWVKNEWKRYIDFMKTDRDKVLIPVYKDISPYTLPDDFAKLQAQDMSKLGAIQDLVHGVEKIIGKKDTQKGVLGEHEKALLDSLEKSHKRNKLFKKIAIVVGITMILMLTVRDIVLRNIIPFDFPLLFTRTADLYFKSTTSLGIFALMAGILDIGIIINWHKGIKSEKAYGVYMGLFSVVSFTLIIARLIGCEITKYAVVLYFAFSFIPIISTLIMFFKEKKCLLKSLALTFVIIIVTVLFIAIKPQRSNDRDNSLIQVEIVIEKLNLREEASAHSKKVGYVAEGEIYTVLDTVYNSSTAWYKIETEQGYSGYISSGDGKYAILLDSSAGRDNGRDESVAQIKINTEYLNMR